MASYSEVVVSRHPYELNWGLGHLVLNISGFEIPYADEEEICGVKGVNQVRVWLRISSSTIEVSCKGLVESWCKKHVQEFCKALEREMVSGSSKKEEQYQQVVKRHMPVLVYKIPEKVCSPVPDPLSKSWIMFAAGIVSTTLLVVLFRATWDSSSETNWGGAILLGSGPALGYIIRYSAKAGNFHKWKVARLFLTVCAIVFGVTVYIVAYKNGGFEGEKLIRTIIKLFAFFVLPTLTGYAVLSEGKQKHEESAVPDEILLLLRYLFFKNYQEIEVRSTLSKLGWCSEVDQNKAIKAFEAFCQSMELKKMNLKML